MARLAGVLPKLILCLPTQAFCPPLYVIKKLEFRVRPMLNATLYNFMSSPDNFLENFVKAKMLVPRRRQAVNSTKSVYA